VGRNFARNTLRQQKVKRKTKATAEYLPQSTGRFHDVNAGRKAQQISNTTRMKLGQGQTEVVPENPVDFRPATEDNLKSRPVQMDTFSSPAQNIFVL